MQTFDRVQGQYLDHEHEQYPLRQEVITKAEFQRVQKDFQDMKNKFLALNRFLGDNSLRVENNLIKMYNSLREPRELLADIDGGSFKNPKVDLIIDGGSFNGTKNSD